MRSRPGNTGNGDEDQAFDVPQAARSEISGDVFGASVQARDIHGGVHFHQADPRMPAPSQLPPMPYLIGRETELAALDAARPSRIVVVSGPAGVGKSTFALHWCHGVRSEFTDGALYADLHGHAPDGPASPSEVLGRFLRALGVSPQQVPAELAEQTAFYRSVTADRHLIILLDDALSAAQVIPLIPSSMASVTLITSRWRLASLRTRGARGIQLDRLEPDAALELLTHTLGDDRAQSEAEAARELVDLCAYLPLALCVAAARLAARPRWPITEMVDAMAHERRRLAALTMEDDTAVRVSLDLSYRALDPAEARLYRLMGLFPGAAFDSGVAAATGAVPRSDARHLLGVLADANLIDDAAGGRYRFHDLTRLHAREMAERDETAEDRNITVRRMLDWFLTVVTNAAGAARPYRQLQPRDVRYPPAEPIRFSGPAHALDWLDHELPTLVAAIRLAADNGLYALAWQLADVMWPVFLYRGHAIERLDVDEIGLAAARACGDRAGEAKMLNRKGMGLQDVGRLDEAAEHFRHALTIWQELRDEYRVAGSLRRLGHVSAGLRHFGEAVDLLRRALGIYRSLGQTRQIALTLSDLGAALISAHRAPEAITALQEAEHLLGEASDPLSEARTRKRLGTAQEHIGDFATAAENMRRALEVMRDIDSQRGQADVLESLGDLAERTSQLAEARRCYEEALAIFIRLGGPDAARIRNHLRRLADSGQA
jgi:tetratricopeptide (TPR) repeat protein